MKPPYNAPSMPVYDFYAPPDEKPRRRSRRTAEPVVEPPEERPSFNYGVIGGVVTAGALIYLWWKLPSFMKLPSALFAAFAICFAPYLSIETAARTFALIVKFVLFVISCL